MKTEQPINAPGDKARKTGSPNGDTQTKGKSSGAVGYGKPPVEHQFKPGHSSGRIKGCRNKLGEAFIEDLQLAWEKHGMAAIEATIKNHPAQFLKVMAHVLPRDMNLNINPYANMSDEQLTARLNQVQGLLSYQSTKQVN